MSVPLWSWLKELGAHSDVVSWAEPFDADWERAWAECPRGDWLLGLAARRGADRRSIVRAAAACARLGLDHVPDAEGRPRAAIEAAERWCDGDDDPGRRATAKQDVLAAIDEAADPATAAAATAALATLFAIETPDEAAMVPPNVVQAAVHDAGDCAMMAAMGYAQTTCADRVREHVAFLDIALL